MRTMRTVFAAALPIFLAGAASAQERCEFRDDVEISGTATEEIAIDAGAGRLTVTGGEVGAIRVSAKLCASSQDLLDALGVSLDGRRIATDYPNRSGWRRSYARIDLAVQVPAGTHVRVEDGSGSITISGVGDVTMEDGSGSVTISDAGNVVLEDGAGSMTLARVGSVDVEDASGSLRITDASGDVDVRDGSGSMEIEGVTGNVAVEDGAGSIRIRSVGGSVRIASSAGGVAVHDVEGDLVVTDGRRERVRYSNIGGTVDLPRGRR